MMLETILFQKKEEVAAKKMRQSLDEVKARANAKVNIKVDANAKTNANVKAKETFPLAGEHGEQREYGEHKASLKRALAAKEKDGEVRLIAEIKKASPSQGVFRPDFNPVELAACYEKNGAAAVSVLTNERFFQGSLAYLRQVKESIRLPVLCKDFIIDPYQIYEAKNFGADAILLIAAVLSQAELSSFVQLAREIELEVLLEVHSSQELKRALSCGAEIIGINNRDLRTFKCDLRVTLQLAEEVPASCLLVSESGIYSVHQIRQLAAVGVDAVLVGESILTSSDRGQKVRELTGREK